MPGDPGQPLVHVGRQVGDEAVGEERRHDGAKHRLVDDPGRLFAAVRAAVDSVVRIEAKEALVLANRSAEDHRVGTFPNSLMSTGAKTVEESEDRCRSAIDLAIFHTKGGRRGPMSKTTQHTSPQVLPRSQTRLLALGLAVTLAGSAVIGCKSRSVSFGEDSNAGGNSPSSSDQNRAGQIAKAQQSNPSSGSGAQKSESVTAVPYAPLQGSQKKLALGSTQRFEVNGQQVDVTFEQIIEDSRCPKDVVCVWEGQAKLQFALSAPALGLSKKVVPTLRTGHPELGQVLVGTIGLDLVGLSPDAESAGQKAVSPEATVVVGKAP